MQVSADAASARNTAGTPLADHGHKEIADADDMWLDALRASMEASLCEAVRDCVEVAAAKLRARRRDEAAAVEAGHRRKTPQRRRRGGSSSSSSSSSPGGASCASASAKDDITTSCSHERRCTEPLTSVAPPAAVLPLAAVRSRQAVAVAAASLPPGDGPRPPDGLSGGGGIGRGAGTAATGTGSLSPHAILVELPAGDGPTTPSCQRHTLAGGELPTPDTEENETILALRAALVEDDDIIRRSCSSPGSGRVALPPAVHRTPQSSSKRRRQQAAGSEGRTTAVPAVADATPRLASASVFPFAGSARDASEDLSSGADGSGAGAGGDPMASSAAATLRAPATSPGSSSKDARALIGGSPSPGARISSCVRGRRLFWLGSTPKLSEICSPPGGGIASNAPGAIADCDGGAGATFAEAGKAAASPGDDLGAAPEAKLHAIASPLRRRWLAGVGSAGCATPRRQRR